MRGKIVFKTKQTHWLHTESPAIALISIDSAIHDGMNGHFKMNAFVSTIRQHTKGRVSVLFADTAHIHTQGIKLGEKVRDACTRSARMLANRYESYCRGCDLLYWDAVIRQDAYFGAALAQVRSLAQTDAHFRDLLHADAKSAYSEKRSQEYPDQELFMEKTKEDLLEQCASILVLSRQGYRYQFYPGEPFSVTQYVNCALLAAQDQLAWINVFLAIEKKTETAIDIMACS